MIQFKTYGNIPKSFYDGKMKYISTRKTLYGVHKNKDKYSKTHLICFTEAQHAKFFKDYLLQIQSKGRDIERCSEMENVIFPIMDAPGKKLPLEIIECRLAHLMKMCHLNFFDMYVIFDVVKGDYDTMTLKCYLYESTGYPNRGYINCHLNQMMYGYDMR